MSFFSCLICTKQQEPDQELKTIIRPISQDTEKNYSISKELLNPEPPHDLISSTNETPEDLQVLQDKRKFEDYFWRTNSEYIQQSPLVKSESPLFEELLRLESEENWEVKLEKDFAKIYIKNLEVPLVKAFFNMKVDASPDVLNEILYNVERRLSWDSSVIDYRVLEELDKDAVIYYMMNKAPWPLNNRDFVETRFMRCAGNGDIEVVYKESQKVFVVDEKVERGHTLFGGQVFRRVVNKGQGTLIVTLVSQSDLSGNLPPKVLKETLPISLLNWYKSVRKELLKVCQESLVDL